MKEDTSTRPGPKPPESEATDPSSEKMINFDHILEEVGEFGLYQGMIVGIMFIMMMTISYHSLFMCFAATPPTWTCIDNATSCKYNGTLPGDDDLRCHLPRGDWTYIEPTSSIVSEFDIDCNRRWWIEVMSSVFFVGWCIGACVMGWFGETYGRKLTLLFSMGAVLSFGFAAAFSPNLYMFTVLRFVIGFVTPGVQSQCVVLASELTGTKWRGTAVTATISGYAVGCAVMSLVSYHVRTWRRLLIYSTVPYAFLGVFIKFLPESPRWLIVKGRTSSFSNLIQNMAKWNRTSVSNALRTSISVEPISVEVNMQAAKPNVINLFAHGVVKTLVQAYFTFCLGVGLRRGFFTCHPEHHSR